MIKTLQNYLTGMAIYDCCHPPTIRSQWLALNQEIREFLEKPSIDEIWDILHSAGKLINQVTGVPFQLVAWPTVRKHSGRFAESGCIRSQRNCESRCCLHQFSVETDEGWVKSLRLMVEIAKHI